jgi:phosphoglycolate phosphatase-like HAD superfamily hydrolase
LGGDIPDAIFSPSFLSGFFITVNAQQLACVVHEFKQPAKFTISLVSGAHPSFDQESMSSADLMMNSIEFAASFAPRPGITHVLFDFDGTISLIREGWPEVMVPMFVEMLPPRAGETDAERRQLMLDDIMRLNGKQTIYQMIQLADRIAERGGTPREPLWYKKEYLRRLDERIHGRLDAIRSGQASREQFLVHGSRALLENLQQRGLELYLASGTDEMYVKQEAELLDVTRYFGEHIYGAKDDYKTFSKKMVIERILRENQIQGAHLLAFGDGYVEIENTKEAGGLAIAVASDEAHNGSGRVDAWKRERLLGVGAHAVIPDYRDANLLLERIFLK